MTPAAISYEVADPSRRLHYLDNLRVFCMLFGAFLQANRVTQLPATGLITEVSDFFRMATFFLISGYFTQMLLGRYAASAVLKRRLWILLIPFAFGLAVINPITNVIASHYLPGAVPLGLAEAWRGALTGRPILPQPDGVLMHLWFLIILAAFVAISPLIARLKMSATLPLNPALVLPLVTLIVVFYTVLARGFEKPSREL